MTLSRTLRPVFVLAAGLATSSCGMVEGDPQRFEKLAQGIADIPLDGRPAGVRSAAESGLRPAMVPQAAVAAPGPLRVEVMDPHALWDARDAGLRGAVERAAPALIDAAAPVVTQAVVREGRQRTRLSDPAAGAETLQLGAFSSPAAARAAWSRIAAAGQGVAGLTPAFEAVTVDGRSLTRLKVVASADTVRAVCRAADIVDLGCLRRG